MYEFSQLYLYSCSSLWSAGEPNGNRAENCVKVSPNGQFYDVSCDSSLSTACDLALVDLNLRGLANLPSTLINIIDTNYVLVVNNTNPEQMYFQGYYNTVIHYTKFKNRDVSPLNTSF
jgi:hypothetical protein